MGLALRQRGFGLALVGLVSPRIDLKQQLVFLDFGPLLVRPAVLQTLDEIAAHAGTNLNAHHGLGMAGEILVVRDGLDRGPSHKHFRGSVLVVGFRRRPGRRWPPTADDCNRQQANKSQPQS